MDKLGRIFVIVVKINLSVSKFVSFHNVVKVFWISMKNNMIYLFTNFVFFQFLHFNLYNFVLLLLLLFNTEFVKIIENGAIIQ